jgi:beta-xylosidase
LKAPRGFTYLFPLQADGKYVMYYSATPKGRSDRHCVGTAVATNPQGPYTPQATAIACAYDKGGAIDPAGIRDSDGTYYVVYKIDGNNIGHGGNCNNGVAPIVSTPIMLQQLASDAITPVGSPIQILDRDDNDGPLVEAPSLIKVNGKYVLFFSSNCYASTFYDVSYAYASSIRGPYQKVHGNEQPGVAAPLLKTGSYGLNAPGGATISKDGTKLFFHANLNGKDISGGRAMYVADVSTTAQSWGGMVTVL